MRLMPQPPRMLLVFIAAFVGAFMASVLASTESEANHGTGATYDVGGVEVTTYYTPVESYYARDCVQTIQAWPDISTSGPKITAGPYPCSFVSHTKGEGSGKLTSGAYAGSYLNWSYEGLGPNGDQQGFWIDTCPRDSYGGCLQAKVTAAVSENLAQNFGLRRGETFHLESCGTEALNTTACDYFRSGNWLVNDQFTTGIASDKQIDLYYGEQQSADFRDSAYWTAMYDAAIRVNPPPEHEPSDTSITSGPSGTVNSTTAGFAFSSTEAGATFECSLDGGPFGPCPSPTGEPQKANYSGLSEGPHAFEVRAIDAVGHTDLTPARQTWLIDTIPPDVPTITSPQQNGFVASSFSIAGTAEPNTTVEVFDGTTSKGTVQASASGTWSKAFDGVGEGTHTYTARATDAPGNTSPASDTRTLVVDTTAPETTIGSGPSGTVNSTTAGFAFSSTEAGATFECSLDGGPFGPCPSPTGEPQKANYSGLSEGPHAFEVRAIDAALNTDTTSASRTWRVDTVAPRGKMVIKGGAASTASRTVRLALSATDPAPASGIASMRFRNSGTTAWSAWQTYATSRSWRLTSGAGKKTVYVRYRDKAGNLSATKLDSITYRP